MKFTSNTQFPTAPFNSCNPFQNNYNNQPLRQQPNQQRSNFNNQPNYNQPNIYNNQPNPAPPQNQFPASQQFNEEMIGALTLTVSMMQASITSLETQVRQISSEINRIDAKSSTKLQSQAFPNPNVSAITTRRVLELEGIVKKPVMKGKDKSVVHYKVDDDEAEVVAEEDKAVQIEDEIEEVEEILLE